MYKNDAKSLNFGDVLYGTKMAIAIIDSLMWGNASRL